MAELHIELVKRIDSESGFFSDVNFLYYCQKNVSHLSSQEMNTVLINMNTNVTIRSVSNDSSFVSGSYNILAFKGDRNSSDAKSFIKLCEVFSNNKSDFLMFFYSLIDLFSVPSEQNHKNSIGLFGELSLILYIYEHFHFNVEEFWHSGTSSDKYDIAFADSQLEIKTTTKDYPQIMIKHSQLFNKENTYLSVVSIAHDNSGISTMELIEKISTIMQLDDNLNFWIKISKEQSRIDEEELLQAKYELVDISIYSANELLWINEVPDEITKLEYQYDLSNKKALDENELESYFKEQMITSQKEKN